MNERLASLQKMLEKYEGEALKRRLEGREAEALQLDQAALRTRTRIAEVERAIRIHGAR